MAGAWDYLYDEAKAIAYDLFAADPLLTTPALVSAVRGNLLTQYAGERIARDQGLFDRVSREAAARVVRANLAGKASCRALDVMLNAPWTSREELARAVLDALPHGHPHALVCEAIDRACTAARAQVAACEAYDAARAEALAVLDNEPEIEPESLEARVYGLLPDRWSDGLRREAARMGSAASWAAWWRTVGGVLDAEPC